MASSQEDTYFTVHVTPQQECSFVSFETNLEQESYDYLITRVLELFQPGRCTLTLFASEVRQDRVATFLWESSLLCCVFGVQKLMFYTDYFPSLYALLPVSAASQVWLVLCSDAVSQHLWLQVQRSPVLRVPHVQPHVRPLLANRQNHNRQIQLPELRPVASIFPCFILFIFIPSVTIVVADVQCVIYVAVKTPFTHTVHTTQMFSVHCYICEGLK